MFGSEPIRRRIIRVHLYKREGRMNGRTMDNWLEAERLW
ncbi:MAG: DUF2934 domain-containing protein [bacterium]